MKTAFHGSQARKTELLERLDRHVAAGMLVIGATAWDGVRGTPLGVLARSVEVDAFAEATGYPLALAGFLDTWTALIRDPDAATAFARDWIARVPPGADLGAVPTRVIIDILGRVAPTHGSAEIVARLRRLHERALVDGGTTRDEWAVLRRDIVTAADAARDELERAALTLCEVAAWPARSSRSILASVASAWCAMVEFETADDWSGADRHRAQELLHALWEAHADDRAAGQYVDYPALFAAREPDLAAGFERDLARTNRMHGDRVVAIGQIVLDHMASAPIAEDA